MHCCSLHAKTLELLQQRPRILTYERLEEVLIDRCPQGVSISSSWLEQFATNRVKHVSVDKVQVLYEYFAGKPLLVD